MMEEKRGRGAAATFLSSMNTQEVSEHVFILNHHPSGAQRRCN